MQQLGYSELKILSVVYSMALMLQCVLYKLIHMWEILALLCDEDEEDVASDYELTLPEGGRQSRSIHVYCLVEENLSMMVRIV